MGCENTATANGTSFMVAAQECGCAARLEHEYPDVDVFLAQPADVRNAQARQADATDSCKDGSSGQPSWSTRLVTSPASLVASRCVSNDWSGSSRRWMSFKVAASS
jgi:hypothetical protein